MQTGDQIIGQLIDAHKNLRAAEAALDEAIGLIALGNVALAHERIRAATAQAVQAFTAGAQAAEAVAPYIEPDEPERDDWWDATTDEMFIYQQQANDN